MPPFIKDVPHRRDCYIMDGKSCNEYLFSKNSENYFLHLNMILLFKINQSSTGGAILCLIDACLVLNHKPLPDR